MASKKYEKSTNRATKFVGRCDGSLESSHSLPALAKAARTEQLRADAAVNEQLPGLLHKSYASVNRSERRTNWNEQAVIEQLAVHKKRRVSPYVSEPIFRMGIHPSAMLPLRHFDTIWEVCN